MTTLEHSSLNRADAGEARDQSGAEPRTQVRETGVRAALIEVLRDAIPPRMTEGYYARVTDRILALVPLERELNEWASRALRAEQRVEVLEDSERRAWARVRPVEGVVLTTEEARLAERALREYGAEPYTLDYSDSDAMDALAARLEATS